jgi:hypothetical protein
MIEVTSLPTSPAPGSAPPERSPIVTWLRRVALLGLWGAAIGGVSNLHRVTGRNEHSFCGPWGCTGPTEALLSYHGFWLALIAPPAVALGLHLPIEQGRRLGWRLLLVGLFGVIVIAAWGSIGWWLRVDGPNAAFWLERGLFELIDRSDIPVAQIAISGAACLVAARVARRHPPEVAGPTVNQAFDRSRALPGNLIERDST